jgi:hypothetical protein
MRVVRKWAVLACLPQEFADNIGDIVPTLLQCASAANHSIALVARLGDAAKGCSLLLVSLVAVVVGSKSPSPPDGDRITGQLQTSRLRRALPTIIIYDTFGLAMTLLIREYLTADGRNPFREWLNRLDRPAKARILARVLRFGTGNLGDHKSAGGGVCEARVFFGTG